MFATMKNVIDAFIELGVKKLIYTGSGIVVFDGAHSIIYVDESLPYPVKELICSLSPTDDRLSSICD